MMSLPAHLSGKQAGQSIMFRSARATTSGTRTKPGSVTKKANVAGSATLSKSSVRTRQGPAVESKPGKSKRSPHGSKEDCDSVDEETQALEPTADDAYDLRKFEEDVRLFMFGNDGADGTTPQSPASDGEIEDFIRLVDSIPDKSSNLEQESDSFEPDSPSPAEKSPALGTARGESSDDDLPATMPSVDTANGRSSNQPEPELDLSSTTRKRRVQPTHLEADSKRRRYHDLIIAELTQGSTDSGDATEAPRPWPDVYDDVDAWLQFLRQEEIRPRLKQQLAEEQHEYRQSSDNWDALLEDPKAFYQHLRSLRSRKADVSVLEKLDHALDFSDSILFRQTPGGKVSLADPLVSIVRSAVNGFFLFTASTLQINFWLTFISAVMPFFQRGRGRGIVILPSKFRNADHLTQLRYLEDVCSLQAGDGRNERSRLRFVFASEGQNPLADELVAVLPGGQIVEAHLGGDVLGDHGIRSLAFDAEKDEEKRREAITSRERLTVFRHARHSPKARQVLSDLTDELGDFARGPGFHYVTPTLYEWIAKYGTLAVGED